MDLYLKDLVDGSEDVQMEASGEESEQVQEASSPDVVQKKPAGSKKVMCKLLKKKPSAAAVAAPHVMKKPAALAAVSATSASSSGSVGGGDDANDKFRDRLKSRKFDKMWDDLPPFIQQEHERLSKLKDGNGRAKITQLINRTIQRDGEGNLVLADTGGAWFQDILIKQKTKYFQKGQKGGSVEQVEHSHVDILMYTDPYMHPDVHGCTHTCVHTYQHPDVDLHLGVCT